MCNSVMQAKSSHLVLLDAGNTRIKWRVANTQNQTFVDQSQQSFATSGLQSSEGFLQLAQQLVATATQFSCREIWICHVLGAGFMQQLEEAVLGLDSGLTLRAPLSGQSVKLQSFYEEPSRLGLDRWMACLACLDLDGMENALHCVVSFGTATTIDAVVKSQCLKPFGTTGKQAVHLGGVIIPGVDLMRDSLHSNTAQLPQVQIQYQRWPTSTESAIASGIVRAQWSAVLSFVKDLEAEFGQSGRNGPDGPCKVWVHGGHAQALLPFIPADLSHSVQPLHDAVFRGLICTFLEAQS